MDFERDALYQPYNTHPLLSDFIQQHWLPCVEDFLDKRFCANGIIVAVGQGQALIMNADNATDFEKC